MSAEDTTPEWFQMAQDDGYAPKPKKNKVLRVAALATPLFVLGAGLVFAQSQGSPTAVASASASLAAANPAPISLASSTPVSAGTANVVQVSQITPATPTTPASITIKRPAITMPTGGGDDDGLSTGDDN